MKLLLLRHALAEGNPENRFIGVTDSPLLPEGERQALRAAAAAPRVEHIYVSPLSRCRRTAELVWPGTAQTVIKELRETDFGPIEGKTHTELSGSPLYEAWLADPDAPEIGAPGALIETQKACAERAAKAWNVILEDAEKNGYGTAAVVTHGGTLMNILYRHALPQRALYSWKTDNCSGYLVSTPGAGGQVRIEAEFRTDDI